MGMTADYSNSRPAMLEKELGNLEAEVAKLQKQRKDEKRFLDVDAEIKKLAEIKAEIAAAISEAQKQAEAYKLDAEEVAKKAINQARAKADAEQKTIDSEWKKLQAQKQVLLAEEQKFADAVSRLTEEQTKLEVASRKYDEDVAKFQAAKKAAIEALT